MKNEDFRIRGNFGFLRLYDSTYRDGNFATFVLNKMEIHIPCEHTRENCAMELQLHGHSLSPDYDITQTYNYYDDDTN